MIQSRKQNKTNTIHQREYPRKLGMKLDTHLSSATVADLH